MWKATVVVSEMRVILGRGFGVNQVSVIQVGSTKVKHKWNQSHTTMRNDPAATVLTDSFRTSSLQLV